MGLAERRALKEFQDTVFPGLKESLDAAAGFTVEVEVNWDSLAEDNMGHLFNDAWPKIFFVPLTEGFKSICGDDMGKEALKGSLKKIVLCNEAGVYGDKAISFDAGVLKIDHKPFSNIDDTGLRTKAVVSCLENGL